MPLPCRPDLAGEEGQRTFWGGQGHTHQARKGWREERGTTPIQPHKAEITSVPASLAD